MFWRLIGLSLVGYLGTRLLSGKSGSRNVAYAEGQPHDFHTDVRDAGPGAMRDGCDGEWTEVDEDLDESFPASDPPGGY